MISAPLLQAGAIALAVSLAANVGIGWLWLDARDDRAKAEVEAKNSAELATRCSEGVDSLRAAADRQTAAAEAATRAAAAAQRVAEGRATAILSRAPTVPGNACASAQVQVDDWLATRRPK